MARMTAMQAAIQVLESDGVQVVFSRRRDPAVLRGAEGEPDQALRGPPRGGRRARRRGYSRAKAGRIGVNIGTSGPAGTDMITGLYSAIADSTRPPA